MIARLEGLDILVTMASTVPPGGITDITAERGGGLRGGTHCAAAKSGILGFARALAGELGPENIWVNAVCPGPIWTGRRDRREMEEQFGSQLPMRRVGTPAEVGGCFLFLASDLASFVTGATLDVNGGMHIA